MKRTVPHQHRILAERSWARGGPSPGEDVSRGRLGCPTSPRVGAPSRAAPTRDPPPIQQPPFIAALGEQTLNSAAPRLASPPTRAPRPPATS